MPSESENEIQSADALKAEVLIGDDAKTFIESELGRTILGMAEQDVERALVVLDGADPADTKAMAIIQNRIWRARSFKAWLIELINNGEQALEVIHGQTRGENG